MRDMSRDTAVVHYILISHAVWNTHKFGLFKDGFSIFAETILYFCVFPTSRLMLVALANDQVEKMRSVAISTEFWGALGKPP